MTPIAMDDLLYLKSYTAIPTVAGIIKLLFVGAWRRRWVHEMSGRHTWQNFGFLSRMFFCKDVTHDSLKNCLDALGVKAGVQSEVHG